VTISGRLLYAAGALLGEGPVVFPDGSLIWVDLLSGIVHSHLADKDSRVGEYEFEVSKVLPTLSGRVVFGRELAIWEFTDGRPPIHLRLAPSGKNLRCSDAAALPNGSLVVGIVDRDLAAHGGRLVHVDVYGSVRTIAEGTTISNGIALDNDGTHAYFTDSPTQRIDVFDVDPDSGTLSARRPFASIPSSFGTPDGLCTDADGGVWVALWGGGRIVRLDRQGEIDASVELPVEHVSSCAFAGQTSGQIYITTGAVLLTEDERRSSPGAGGLWCAETRTTGSKVFTAMEPAWACDA